MYFSIVIFNILMTYYNKHKHKSCQGFTQAVVSIKGRGFNLKQLENYM